MKLLLIRFSSIGDIVLTTPVIRCLKQQLPHAEIHYLTKSTFSSIIDTNPYIQKRYYLNDNLPEIIEELKKEKYDEIIDLHHNLRTLRIKKALNIPSHSLNKLNLPKWMLVNFKINLMPPHSIVERYMDTVKHLGVKNDGKGLDFFVNEQENVTTKDLPMSHWAGYAGCVIGGSYFTKRLPVEKWKEFILSIPYPVILIGGPEDKEEGDRIAQADPVKIYNACGKFNLSESALLIKHAKVIAANDTGMMHVAAAFQKPVISFWGNTSPEMGMFPYYGMNDLKSNLSSKLSIIENKTLSCHPCSKIGYNKCPKRHFKCMKELDMNKAGEVMKVFWNG